MTVLFSWLILIALSLASGLMIHLAFRRFSDREKLRAVKRRKRAWLYELRLYVDEPGLIWRAQIALLKDTIRHVGLLTKPLLVLSLPLLFVYLVLDSMLSRVPLPAGRATTLTVRFTPPFPDAAPLLDVPDGVAIETPPVRIPLANEVSWRIRPSRALSGTVRVQFAEETAEGDILARPGMNFRMPQRRWGKRIQSVDIQYPNAGQGWLLWFSGISLGTFLLLNLRYRVAF